MDQCTKPTIDLSERKCFLCKKTGHSARHCKDKPKSIHNVENAPRDSLAMMDCDGFIPIQRRTTTTTNTPSQRPTRSQPATHIDGKKDFVKESMNSDAKLREKPMPRQPVLGDYLSKNTFAALAATGEEVESIGGVAPNTPAHGAGGKKRESSTTLSIRTYTYYY